GNQTKLTISNNFVAWFQTILDHNHLVIAGSRFYIADFNCHIWFDCVNEGIVLSDLNGLRWNHNGLLFSSQCERYVSEETGVQQTIGIFKSSFESNRSGTGVNRVVDQRESPLLRPLG